MDPQWLWNGICILSILTELDLQWNTGAPKAKATEDRAGFSAALETDGRPGYELWLEIISHRWWKVSQWYLTCNAGKWSLRHSSINTSSVLSGLKAIALKVKCCRCTCTYWSFYRVSWASVMFDVVVRYITVRVHMLKIHKVDQTSLFFVLFWFSQVRCPFFCDLSALLYHQLSSAAGMQTKCKDKIFSVAVCKLQRTVWRWVFTFKCSTFKWSAQRNK